MNTRATALAVLLAALATVVVATADAANINGTAKSDTIKGTAKADKLYGKGGSDKLYGLGGSDYLNGGAGNDLLVGGAGADAIVCGAGVDSVIADAADKVASDCEKVTGLPKPALSVADVSQPEGNSASSLSFRSPRDCHARMSSAFSEVIAAASSTVTILRLRVAASLREP